jgi:hypothetical protein
MRPALPDYSTMPTWPTWVWVLIVAVAVVALAKWVTDQMMNAPVQPGDHSHLDHLDGLHEGEPACHSAGPRGGHYVRAAGEWWVCAACGGAWPRVDDQPYDQEAAS